MEKEIERQSVALVKLDEKLSRLSVDLVELRKDVQKLISTCSRMDGHISFVEKVYETVKFPISYIAGKMASLRSYSPTSLPIQEEPFW